MLTFWLVFHVVITLFLLADLLLLHRDHHAVSLREAAWTSAFWIGVALLFAVGVAVVRGRADGVTFLAAYLMEKSLSMDNLFVFYLLFKEFGIRREDEHSLLFYGVIGAVVMRAIFITLGIGLVSRFHFLFYIFGAFLIWSGIGMARAQHDEEVESRIVAWLRRWFAVAPAGSPGLFHRVGGKVMLTSGAFALIAIEVTDLLFAVDSIPAVIGLTHDFFLAYTSNILAILGLRALFFLLSGVIGRFKSLHFGLSFVLVFIGVKMVIADFLKIPVAASLGVIILAVAIPIIVDLRRPAPSAD